MKSCGTCRWFKGQTFPKKPGWKRAAGRCGFPVPVIHGLPESITRGHSGKVLRDPESLKNAVWPDDGVNCPCWEAVDGQA